MQNSVASGYRTSRNRAQRRRISGHRAQVHHNDQPMWRLGMAAYWLEILATVPESNDHKPPTSASVSVNPYGPTPCCCARAAPPYGASESSNRGGMSGNIEKPTMASPVVKASTLRHCVNRAGARKYSQKNAASVTMKWNVP